MTPRGCGCYHSIAGWSSLVARWAHNPKVGGSNPHPATNPIIDLGAPTRERPLRLSAFYPRCTVSCPTTVATIVRTRPRNLLGKNLWRALHDCALHVLARIRFLELQEDPEAIFFVADHYGQRSDCLNKRRYCRPACADVCLEIVCFSTTRHYTHCIGGEPRAPNSPEPWF